MFTCYETNQTFPKAIWKLIYYKDIDHKEYPTFNMWWYDMLRSHVLEKQRR